jgi:hypothetical protein
MSEPKKTQGNEKMLLYIDDLVRNKNFIRSIKRVKRLQKKNRMPEGSYYTWTKEQQAEHDRINNEAGSVIEAYEKLRKRCKKLLRSDYHISKEKIASEYGLDNDSIAYALSLYDTKDKNLNLGSFALEDPDMCRVVNIYEETMSPLNKGEEIIYLRPDLQLLYNAYPMAIVINSNASKRDVLDFIEKRWQFVEQNLRQFDNQKGLKIRKRKHSKEVVDFIWKHRGLKTNQIQDKLNNEFPDNDLVYFEINKMIQQEKKRRLKTWFDD